MLYNCKMVAKGRGLLAMKRCGLLAAVLMVLGLASCDMMTEDRDDCPTGLYLTFKYDYNLERANMFNDHVGSVTLYVYDTNDKLVRTYEESNSAFSQPLKDVTYTMHLTDLEAGSYKFIALAQQSPYSETINSSRAHFVRSGIDTGSAMSSVTIKLDRQTDGDHYDIENNALPLDTLWHGIETNYISVYSDKPTYDTISLVRDTKRINVSLRELDDPTTMDIDNYEMTITDHNSIILWDNSLDESDEVVYTPYDMWNTSDKTDAIDTEGNVLSGAGQIGHADFMTSRILNHDSAADDGVLTVTNKNTGVVVAALNLPDILCQLRNSDDLHRYSAQEFLDRGYDFDITLFVKGDKLQYISIAISVLGWEKRIQFAELSS
ncbi:MAG: FimB/Mfa2 family fimbrial subunit [Prevotella sp.]|nr:FimB/Mfa2 family fimbrial subunit [Prevotella sp.]